MYTRLICDSVQIIRIIIWDTHNTDAFPQQTLYIKVSVLQALSLFTGAIIWNQLIDWTGRAILPNKAGSIAMAEPKILQRLNIGSGDWLDNIPRIEKDFHHCIGRGESIKPYAEKLDQCWVKVVGAARKLFGH